MENQTKDASSEGRVVFNWKSLDENPTINLIVRSLAGSEYQLSARLSDTLDQLKDKIEAQHGVPKDQQRLIHGAKELTDDVQTVEECGIQDGNVIHLILRLRC